MYRSVLVTRAHYVSDNALSKPSGRCCTWFTRFALCLIACLANFLVVPNLNAAENAFAEESLRAGFYSKSFPDFSAEDVEITIKLLSEELGKDVGVEAKVTAYDDIQTLRRDFETGVINFVVASSILLATEFDTTLFTDGFRLVLLDELADRLLVLGQLKANKNDFGSYRGQRLVLPQHEPMTNLYVDYLSWLNFKQSYQTSFNVIQAEKKAHQVMLMLFFNQADLTCIYQNVYKTAVEMNPQLEEKLKILAEVDNLPQGIGFFHKNTPEAFREKVIVESAKIHQRPRGQQLLQLFKSERAIRAGVDDMAAVIQLYGAHKRLSGKQ